VTLGLVWRKDGVTETKRYKVRKLHLVDTLGKYLRNAVSGNYICRKRAVLFLQSSVGTRNRCCGQYMHCFIGNLFRCKSAKNYKILLRFHKAISI